MADEDKSIDIVIRTKAELEGAEAVEAALTRDVEAAKELEETRQTSKPREEQRVPQTDTGTAASGEREIVEERSPEMPEMREDGRIVAMGERLAAALERNGELMAAMLQRSLEVAEEQQRQLGELERRLEQLGRRVQGSYNK